MASNSTKVVWEPFPGSQTLALDSPADITLYTGTRGPGKTDCQLMRFRRRVGIGYGSHWRGVIFDREYKNLDDIVNKSKRWFPMFEDGAKFHSSKGDLKWTWPTGEELLFRAAADEKDYYDYHGHEYPFIGWNELTKYPNAALFDAMMSTNRSSFVSEDGSVPPIPLEVFITTNPYGPGHNWVKRRFIDPAPYGNIVRKKFEIDKPGTIGGKVEVEMTQVALFGSWKENPRLDPKYIASLLSEKNEARRAAWANGSWDIVAGGAFDDVFDRKHHVLPRFVIPDGWRIDRGFDWGSTHPFYVGWFAESDGNSAEIIFNGESYEFSPPKGTLVLFAEWYGTNEIGTNQGLRLSAPDIAKGILNKEKALRLSGWISGVVNGGPADNQIFDVREQDVSSIASKMAELGVTWVRCDKSRGARKNGLQLVRDRFEATVRKEGKRLYITENCEAALATIPVLPRDPDDMDDVDTDAEDHPYDVLRYRILHADHVLNSHPKITFM